MSAVVPGVGTEATRKPPLDVAPSSWPPRLGVAMWLVSKVMSLANVD